MISKKKIIIHLHEDERLVLATVLNAVVIEERGKGVLRG